MKSQWWSAAVDVGGGKGIRLWFKAGDEEPKTGDGEPKTRDGEPKTGEGEPKINP